MSTKLPEVIAHLDSTLEIHRFRDYGPNGLQVEGTKEIKNVVTGVSANLSLFEKAIEREAQLVVVHHGLIWGPGIPRVTGLAAERLRTLLERRISLAAYHLPLDKHARLGNNAGLADAIGLGEERGEFGEVRGHALGLYGSFDAPVSRAEAVERISDGVVAGADMPFVFPFGPQKVNRVGLCTGAASDLLEDAAKAGCDLFITGELAERASEVARELGITLIAAGHYATEVFGPRRLAKELDDHFPEIDCEFVDVPCPL